MYSRARRIETGAWAVTDHREGRTLPLLTAVRDLSYQARTRVATELRATIAERELELSRLRTELDNATEHTSAASDTAARTGLAEERAAVTDVRASDAEERASGALRGECATRREGRGRGRGSRTFAPPPSLRWLPTDRSLPTESERPRGVPGRERAVAEPMHCRSADKRSQVSVCGSSSCTLYGVLQYGRLILPHVCRRYRADAEQRYTFFERSVSGETLESHHPVTHKHQESTYRGTSGQIERKTHVTHVRFFCA